MVLAKDSVALIEDDVSDETFELIKSGILEGEPDFEIDGSLDELPEGNDELLNPGTCRHSTGKNISTRA